jgi:hypothetical protein
MNVPAEEVSSTSDDRTVNNVMRHTYRVLSDEEKKAMQAVKDAGASFVAELGRFCHPGRETSLAITNAEQAVMWAVKGITA